MPSYRYAPEVFFVAFILISWWNWFFLAITLIGALAIAIGFRHFVNRRLPVPAGGAVVITGTRVGIGKDAVQRFADNGVYVFATVRKAEHRAQVIDGAKNPDLIHTLEMDVTDLDTIAAAAKEVEATCEEKNLTLLSVINNAGFGDGGAAIETISRERLERQFDVNVFGVVSVSQAFLPLMRKFKPADRSGRLILVSSIGGKLTIAGMTLYCATKYALESIAQGLRNELRPFNIDTICINPGGTDTEFFKVAATTRAAEITNPHLEPEAKKVYEACLVTAGNRKAARSPVSGVSDAMEEAVFDSMPNTNYFTGRDARIFAIVAKIIPNRFIEKIMSRYWHE